MSYDISLARTGRLCFCFLAIESQFNRSLFTKFWIVCLLVTVSSQNLRRNFPRHFLVDLISRRWHTEIHVALKRTAPWRNTLFTNCNWEQMANRANSCRPQLTNHKQIPTHEPHCSPAIRHTESSAKFVCSSQPAVHRSPWSAES
jgi:hypothetical protein